MGRDSVVVPVGVNGKAGQADIGWARLDNFSGLWCAETDPSGLVLGPEVIRAGGW